MIEMTADLLLEELRRAREATTAADEVHGLTFEEMRASTKFSTDRLRDKIHALHAEGRLIVGRRTVPDITGRMNWKPTYALKGT